MLEALGCTHAVHINSGSGQMDLLNEFAAKKPDVFVVNSDVHAEAKVALCAKHSTRYMVLERIPHAGLKPRSTTDLRNECTIPFRSHLAGG